MYGNPIRINRKKSKTGISNFFKVPRERSQDISNII